MKALPIYQVDAFAEQLFRGNPAAVCPLTEWLPDAMMQTIAAENNVSETAFFVPTSEGGADYALRWFTPEVEVPLCGHATLASGYVLFTQLGFAKPRLVFSTKSGLLTVEQRGDVFWLDLPSQPPQPIIDVPTEVVLGLGAAPQELLATPGKYFAVYAEASTVADLEPDMAKLSRLIGKGVIATAPGGLGEFTNIDFVSRYFTPGCGIPEDPVTGSAHCLLVPYWAAKLGKTQMDALQISARRGRLRTELRSDRVFLGGHAQLFLRGEMLLA